MEHYPKKSKYRFRISNAGLVRKGEILGGSVACPRMILLRDHGIEEEHQIGTEEWFRREITFAIGKANEEVFEKSLQAKDIPYIREDFLCTNLTPDVEIAGAIDFQVRTKPYELKAVSSTRQYEKIFVKGQPKLENVCQILSYMIQLNLTEGVLRYTSTIYHSHYDISWAEVKKLARAGEAKLIASMTKEKWKAKPEKRSFKVEIQEDGTVLVDKSEFCHVSELWDHQALAVSVLEGQTVNEAVPAAGEDGFPPCKLCWWNDVCRGFNVGEINTTAEFLAGCRERNRVAMEVGSE